MQQGARDIVSGGVILVLGIALFVLIPGQVETLEADTLTPAFIPLATTAIICVLAAILLAQGILARTPTESRAEPWSIRPLATMIVTVFVMLVYVGAIPWIGYIAATGAVLVLLALVYGNRSIVQIVILAVVAPPAILVFFRYTMLVLLPQGRLFN
jgi:putative tricarboxylic transport membrane protein